MTVSTFSCARLIKEIGRGPNGARPLSRDDAYDLYAAMLDGRVSDVELGAVLLAYRLKGETPEELSGMLAAAHATIEPLDTPDGAYRAVSIPTYNGARKQANLTPLLAMLLARERVPVLVHGVTDDPGRVTSAEIFAELGISAASETADVNEGLARAHVAFAPIATLSPKMARLLALRRVLGVRNSTHTLVKLLQPFAEPALRLVNYTHPPYRDNLSQLFRDHPDAAAGGALLARGTEGEAVADTRRQVQIDWIHDGEAETLVESERRADDAPPAELPERDAASTARWIERVLAGEQAAPPEIVRQVEVIKRIAARA
ncbi:DNA-binding protein YbiB [Pararobbsia silviterrae]|nr:DNA-binding protein YbiB [Pararobbsia silviterrae]